MKSLQKKPLRKPTAKNRLDGPVLIIILDGLGLSGRQAGDAFAAASTPCYDGLKAGYPYRELFAHGKHVGMASNKDMGNSEVGHNAIGAGKIYSQGSKLVQEALLSGSLFQRKAWKDTMYHVKQQNSALHFLGLLSDGNVHSDITHLMQLSEQAAAEGLKKIYVHALLDGRDTSPQSALLYVLRLEQHFAKLRKKYACSAHIASAGGRMLLVMDRYEADWDMIQRGWDLMVLGEGPVFQSATAGIQQLRKENKVSDQYIPPFLIQADPSRELALIQDGDALINFNFRGDRAIQISLAFENRATPIQKKKKVAIHYVGMTLYDGDRNIPSRFLVNPPSIKNTMGEYLAATGKRQFAISETQKYGHVTFFWNGNRSSKFNEKTETYIEIPSDNVSFDQRPWMKAAEITDAVIDCLKSKKFDCGRVNYPNADMVGHTGNFQASKLAVEAVDLCLARLLKALADCNGIALITADHGNCDEMFEVDTKTNTLKKDAQGNYIVKTSHTLNKVPFFIYDPKQRNTYTWKTGSLYDSAGLAHIAATFLDILGYEAPADYLPSLLKISSNC